MEGITALVLSSETNGLTNSWVWWSFDKPWRSTGVTALDKNNYFFNQSACSEIIL